jgi:20S proteasome alpha/beta subunit
MTVIVWDGRTLAADKRASCNGIVRTTTKIFRVRDMLVGLAGDADYSRAMLQWVIAGMNEDRFPEHQKTSADYVSVLVITKSREILKFERTPYPIVFEDKVFAMGSGRDFALAALHLGCDARRAVEVACALDVSCGNGIDTQDL